MTDARNGGADAERYEQLRAQALDGGPPGPSLGLVLLERRGVAAWSRAWHGTAPARPGQPRSASVVKLSVATSELVGALASMALARVAAG